MPRSFSRIAVLLAVLHAGQAEGFGAPESLWAAADFDGDKVVDLARITVSRQAGSLATPEISQFPLNPASLQPILNTFPHSGLVFSARDVDADKDLDLVLRDTFEGRPVAIWLNDGKGGFSPSEPSKFPRAGDDGPSLDRNARRVHHPAAAGFFKSFSAVLQSGILELFDPQSQFPRLAKLTPAGSTRKDTLRSRAPPFLSF